MSDAPPPPAWISEDEIAGRPKRIMTHPESAVQRGVVRFCRRAIACEFEFVAHDRSKEHGDKSHIFEAARGLRRDWLDCELVLAGGRGFRCELKAPGIVPKKGGGQLSMIARLNALGHPAAWANSVMIFGEEAERACVPLHANWRVIAAHQDEMVTGDIRGQEAKAAAKRAGTHKPSRSKPRGKPSRKALRFGMARLGL